MVANDYQIMHMNKVRLERLGLLPQSIEMMDAADDWLNGKSARMTTTVMMTNE
jgi:hypothetical protein